MAEGDAAVPPVRTRDSGRAELGVVPGDEPGDGAPLTGVERMATAAPPGDAEGGVDGDSGRAAVGTAGGQGPALAP